MLGTRDAVKTESQRPDAPFELSAVTVIIPALNEESALPHVLHDLPHVGQVIVVDNGSHDQTFAVAKLAGATVVTEPRRGYGSACLRGLACLNHPARRNDPIRQNDAAQTMFSEDRVIVFLDADYSDHPEILPELVRPILVGQADFVLGSRLLCQREPGAMPVQSLFGNRLACFLMRWLFRIRYTDLGPFRAIRLKSLERLGMVDRDFGWTVEMQIKAARSGLRIQEIPVPYRRRIGVSKISGTVIGSVRAGLKILYLISKYGILGTRKINPTPAS